MERVRGGQSLDHMAGGARFSTRAAPQLTLLASLTSVSVGFSGSRDEP